MLELLGVSVYVVLLNMAKFSTIEVVPSCISASNVYGHLLHTI